MLASERIPAADYAFTTLGWPLLFLYFKALSTHSHSLKLKSDIKHLALPMALFILVCFKNQIKEEIVIVLLKIGVPVVITYTLGYSFWSYRILKKNLWAKKSSNKSADKQQVAVRKWSQFLFFIFTLILLRFLINPIINQQYKFFNTANNYLFLGALLWIVVYIKLLTSPEFLFGYDVFQDKINKYKLDFFAFENQWNKTISEEITNKKDLVLRGIMDNKYIEYIETIERISQKTNLFLKQGIKAEDLAHKMKIPKSHVVFLFKYYSNISFNEFKRNLRIKKATQLIHQGYLDTNIMESLALEVGFSTYSSFFKNFKDITKIAPQEYHQNVRG
jgi:AraC-like DNA-binding protein